MAQVAGITPLLTPAELCQLLGGNFTNGGGEAALAQMRYTGTGPVFIKITGRQVRYRRSDVEAWLESKKRTRTGDPQGAGV